MKRLALVAALIAVAGFVPIPASALTPPSFTAQSVIASEWAASVPVVIVKSAKASSYSKVSVRTVDGTCKAGVDYKPVALTLTFGNSVLKQTVTVPLIDNATFNGGSCTFTLALTSVRFATIKANATVIITENDTAPPSPVTPWELCAPENGICTFIGTAPVRYGNGVTWVEKTLASPVSCSNVTFGDPLPNVLKRCEVAGTVIAPPTPTPTPVQCPDGTTVPGGQTCPVSPPPPGPGPTPGPVPIPGPDSLTPAPIPAGWVAAPLKDHGFALISKGWRCCQGRIVKVERNPLQDPDVYGYAWVNPYAEINPNWHIWAVHFLENRPETYLDDDPARTWFFIAPDIVGIAPAPSL